jgi:hypothetical protein
MDEFEAVGSPAEAHANDAIDSVRQASGLSAGSLALYSRWWQLETWLRELAYLELRTKYGIEWFRIVSDSTWRQDLDASYTHLAGPDNENPLAYLDYSKLLGLLDSNWPLFSHTLMEKTSWDGRQAELKQIRHRIAHLRRSNPDDLGRIELILRDLERGAFIAVSEYNNRWVPPHDSDNPIITGWIDGEHEVARRLVDHADRQYDTRLQVRRSIRPWAAVVDSNDQAGVLWHVDFVTGGRTLNVERFWDDVLDSPIDELLVWADLDSWKVGLTFSGADDKSKIADAIGVAFDIVLTSRALTGPKEWRLQAAHYSDLDHRINVESVWNIVDDTTLPMSMFESGRSTKTRPRYERGFTAKA